jgi:hypothetical protein
LVVMAVGLVYALNCGLPLLIKKMRS